MNNIICIYAMLAGPSKCSMICCDSQLLYIVIFYSRFVWKLPEEQALLFHGWVIAWILFRRLYLLREPSNSMRLTQSFTVKIPNLCDSSIHRRFVSLLYTNFMNFCSRHITLHLVISNAYYTFSDQWTGVHQQFRTSYSTKYSPPAQLACRL